MNLSVLDGGLVAGVVLTIGDRWFNQIPNGLTFIISDDSDSPSVWNDLRDD